MSDSLDRKQFELRLVRQWDVHDIRSLYRAGGWWHEEWDPEGIVRLVTASYLFAVVIDRKSGHAVAMGRVISDGCSDAYIQDLVVLPEFRRCGFGQDLVSTLVSCCLERGITWIALIAEPGTEEFYIPAGFTLMEGYVPMIYSRTKHGGAGPAQ